MAASFRVPVRGRPLRRPLSDRQDAAGQDHARGAPEPDFAVARRLQAENSLVPERIVDEPDVFDLEISLLLFPLLCPGEMRLVELLPQFRNFDRIGIREKNSEQHASFAWFSLPLM